MSAEQRRILDARVSVTREILDGAARAVDVEAGIHQAAKSILGEGVEVNGPADSLRVQVRDPSGGGIFHCDAVTGDVQCRAILNRGALDRRACQPEIGHDVEPDPRAL